MALNWDTSVSLLNWISEADTGLQNGDTSATVLSWMSEAETDPQKGIHQPLY